MADDLETGTSETSLSEDVDLLSEGEDSKTEDVSSEKEEGEIQDEEESETEDTEDENTEEESEVEEEEEETQEITRPSWKTLKEKYPEAAKDKDLREMFFREKAFSDIYPTVEDAKEASEKAQALEFFDNAVGSGDTDTVVRSLNEQAAGKLADNILPSLYKVNPQLFNRAVNPILVDMLNAVADRATNNKDNDLLISAKNVAKFLFGKFEIPQKGSKTSPELENERKQLKEERENLINNQKKDFFSRTDKSIVRQLKNIISEGLDPKKELTEFTRNAIIEKTLAGTRNTLLGDEAFTSKIQNLARLAERAGYPPDYLPRFISAYLGRAKSVALALRAKHKSAAVDRKPAQPKTRIEGSKEETKQISTKQENSVKKKSDMDIIMEGA